jgi:hypothetical protein
VQRGAINECLEFGRDQGGWNVQKWVISPAALTTVYAPEHPHSGRGPLQRELCASVARPFGGTGVHDETKRQHYSRHGRWFRYR